MKKFLSKSIVLFLPVAVLAVLAELVMRQLPTDYKAKSDYLKTHSASTEVLILGSSHALFSINPQDLGRKAYNAAYLGQSLDYDARILAKYGGRMTALNTLIVPLSYPSMFESMDHMSLSWRRYNYNLYYGLEGHWGLADYSELLGKDVLKQLGSAFSYHVLSDPVRRTDSLGWGLRSYPKDLWKSGKASAEGHTRTLDNAEHLERHLQLKSDLDGIVAWCRLHEVNLVFVTTPAFVSYRQELSPDQVELFTGYAMEQAEKNAQCYYWNFMDHPLFTESDFSDATHLSVPGSQKLGALLKDSLDHYQL